MKGGEKRGARREGQGGRGKEGGARREDTDDNCSPCR